MSIHAYTRFLTINLPRKQSAFLWGARKTGKSTYLKTHFSDSVFYDLLKSDLYLKFSKAPYLLREEILALPESMLQYPIILDEVQKIPSLLDEVHWLIENTNAQFILCGSSARKLKKGGVNLLGGRAWRYALYPLIYPEITDFDLLRALNAGTIPSHYQSQNYQKSLKSYIEDYLTQEIQFEGLVRNLPTFARFLDSISFSNGEMTNYNNIARDCSMDAKTVKSYYQILIDTLLGYYVYPYAKKVKRDIISSVPKFYLFDVGVFNALSKRVLHTLKDSQAGKSFEHFIFLELISYRSYQDLSYEILYWRTKTGLEVDFVLEGADIAIEVKISENISKHELAGLLAFAEEHPDKKLYVVCRTERDRKITHEGRDISIINYQHFLEKLWKGQIIPPIP
jgi:predicted AAA+ superfamily ATPase